MSNMPDLWRDPTFGAWRPLLRQLDDFMNDAISSPRMLGEGQTFAPSVDVSETDDHFVMSFDMPGLDKDNIDIEVHGRQLTVSGERKQEREDNRGRSHFVERRYGKFQRVLTLPDGIQPDDVEATYHDGVLTVAVAKAADAKRQKIKIGEGKSGFLGKFLGHGAKKGDKEAINVKASDRTERTDRTDSAPAH
jgi:HSP20 family protein